MSEMQGCRNLRFKSKVRSKSVVNELKQYMIIPPQKTATSVRAHMPFFYWLINNLRPTTYVELGTFTGDSFFGVCNAVQFFKSPTKCVAVDSWKGDEHVGHYNEDIFNTFMGFYNQWKFPFASYVRANFDDAAKQFEDDSIGLLMIDGTHTYEAVKHDFETWLPKVSKRRGVITFHDTVCKEGTFGVYRWFPEVMKQYPNRAFNFSHSFGLGVLLVGSELPNSILSLGTYTPEQYQFIQTVFEAAGKVINDS